MVFFARRLTPAFPFSARVSKIWVVRFAKKCAVTDFVFAEHALALLMRNSHAVRRRCAARRGGD